MSANKSSLLKVYDELVKSCGASDALDFVFTLACVIHKNRKFKEDTTSSSSDK